MKKHPVYFTILIILTIVTVSTTATALFTFNPITFLAASLLFLVNYKVFQSMPTQ